MGSILGVCCSKGSEAAATEEVQAPVPRAANWDRLGGAELEQPLRDGLLKCVDSRYLVNLSRSGGRIERAQDLPETAFIGLEDLKGLGTYQQTMYEPLPATYEWLPVAIVSYSWLGRCHPDPHGETLEVLAKALEQLEPHGVIIDFTALPQAPRSEEEGKSFKSGLMKFNIFYSHPHTLVLQVTDFPAGYPSARSYDLPEGLTPAKYQHRGWCYAEACISSLGKSPKFLCNLSRLPQGAREVVGKCMNESVPPPLSPGVFNEELSKKTFTQKKTDLERVQKLYEDAFTSRIRDAESLMFADLHWKPLEVQSFAQVMEVNKLVQHLDLSNNEVGKEGMMALSRVIKTHKTLRSLHLVKCGLGDGGGTVLGEALKVNTVLTSMDLFSNEIAAEGARSLAEGLKINTALQTLDLQGDLIGDEGAQFMAEALKVNTTLTELNLSSNGIGAEGAHCLAEALKVNTAVAALNLYANDIGPNGARSLAETLKVNTGLTTLDLRANAIWTEGANSLAEALKVNTVLTTLNVRASGVGAEGRRSLAEAARRGCEIIG